MLLITDACVLCIYWKCLYRYMIFIHLFLNIQLYTYILFPTVYAFYLQICITICDLIQLLSVFQRPELCWNILCTFDLSIFGEWLDLWWMSLGADAGSGSLVSWMKRGEWAWQSWGDAHFLQHASLQVLYQSCIKRNHVTSISSMSHQWGLCKNPPTGQKQAPQKHVLRFWGPVKPPPVFLS